MIVTTRWRGMRWTFWRQVYFFAPDENAKAYGEVVWSWRRDAGAKLRGEYPAADVVCNWWSTALLEHLGPVAMGPGLRRGDSGGLPPPPRHLQNRLLTNFESFKPYRHGNSTALVMPIRSPITISTLSVRACSAIGGLSSGSSLCLLVIPSASQSFPGPEHSARSSCNPRRRRIAGIPWVGCNARINTALAEP